MSALHSPIGCNRVLCKFRVSTKQNKSLKTAPSVIGGHKQPQCNCLLGKVLCRRQLPCSLLTAHSYWRLVCFCQLWCCGAPLSCSLSPLINYLSSQSLHLAPASISFISLAALISHSLDTRYFSRSSERVLSVNFFATFKNN